MSYETSLKSTFLKSIPSAQQTHEMSKDYGEALKEEFVNLIDEIKYQINKAVRKGGFSATIEIPPHNLHVWSPVELEYQIRPILVDLGYKVMFYQEEFFTFLIEW